MIVNLPELGAAANPVIGTESHTCQPIADSR
jgi:hypothetical protein